jgi:ABC-type sugar transport system ATPase subunit
VNRETAVLSVEKLSYSLKGQAIVSEVTFSAAAGEVFGIVGPSGAGKTTLLRCISGLLSPSSGRVLVQGHDLARVAVSKRPLAFMQQGFSLYRNLSVIENILAPMRTIGRSTVTSNDAETLLEVFGISRNLFHRSSADLSGGEGQRVALCKALLKDAPLLLLDEPFSNLDKRRRREVSDYIRRLVQSRGSSVLFVSHDENDVVFFADRICLFDTGRVIQIGGVAELRGRPVAEQVASFGCEAGLQHLAKSSVEPAALSALTALRNKLPANFNIAWRPDRSKICTDDMAPNSQGCLVLRGKIVRKLLVTGGAYAQLVVSTSSAEVLIWHFQPDDGLSAFEIDGSACVHVKHEDLIFLDMEGRVLC